VYPRCPTCVVWQDDGPEVEGVRADGCEQDGLHIRVHHAASCCHTVGGGASGSGQHDAISLQP